MEYLNIKELEFIKDSNELLSAKYKDTHYDRVKLYRCFPINNENEYISVVYGDDNIELGIIKNLSELDEKNTELVMAELDMRYFIPTILQVLKYKDKRWTMTIQARTDAGDISIEVRDLTWNIIDNKEKGIIIKDIHENYYRISREYINSKDKNIKFIKNFL